MEGGRKWEDLDFDCLVHIFSKLGLEELFLSLPFVCKPWHDASVAPECWKRLDLRALDLCLPRSRFAPRFRQEYRIKAFSFTALLSLCLARSHGSAEVLAFPFVLPASLHQDVISASIECPRLKVLALPSLKQKDENKLPGLMSNWKKLEFLEMTCKPNCFLEILEQIRKNCPNFVRLHTHGIFNRTEASAMVRCLPKLKILVMSGSFIQKPDLMLIMESCKELELLDVSRCLGFDADEEMVKKASRIQRFQCGGCKLENSCDSSFEWSCML